MRDEIKNAIVVIAMILALYGGIFILLGSFGFKNPYIPSLISTALFICFVFWYAALELYLEGDERFEANKIPEGT